MKELAVREKARAPSMQRLPTAVRAGPAPQWQGEIRHILQQPRLQRKITVGAADDAHEREADAVARQVMSMPEPGHALASGTGPAQAQRLPLSGMPGEHAAARQVQRQEGETDENPPAPTAAEPGPAVTAEEPQPWPELTDEDLAARSAVQRKETAAQATPTVSGALAARIGAPDAGRALPSGVRGFMEPRFGHDFSAVRVHDTQPDRDDAARLSARAFTYGSHVWIGRNERADDLPLMAHELTHVVQQGGAVQRAPAVASPTPRQVRRSLLDAITDPLGALLEKAKESAKKIPGYALLTVILGRDPITDERVERSAVNVVRGVLNLVPGGDAVFDNLQKSGAIEKAHAWLEDQIRTLDLTWERIKAMFRAVVDAVDLLHPLDSLARVVDVFTPALTRLRNFAVAAGRKILEFIFDGVMTLAGPFGQRVATVIRKAGDVVSLIVNDPVGFLKNLVGAVKLGFEQFSTNVLDHLKRGLMDWLFGTLASAGLTMPAKFDLAGIVSIVLQVLGLTYAKLRARLVQVMSEGRVAMLEKSFEFLSTLVTRGLAAAWEKIVEYLGSLQETVIGAIRDFVVTRIVKAAVVKLASLFNPVGAVIQAIVMVYDTIKFFMEKAEQIMALANAVFDSVSNIALGKLTDAANYVEKTMGKAIPVILGFLAGLLGLGGISEKIRDIIKAIQEKVDLALKKVVNFIVEKAKSLLGSARAAVGAALEWWKETREIRQGGRKYTVYFEGSEDAAHLHIASSPGEPYRTWLDAHSPTEAQKPDHTKALELCGKLEARRPPSKTPEQHAEDKTAWLNELATIIMRLTGGTEQPISVIRYDGVNEDGGGKGMTAEILSEKHEEGTRPGDEPPIWERIAAVRNQSPWYVQGHLLNENLGGPGQRFNLTPITKKANSDHLHHVEKYVKKWVNEKRLTAYYQVKAEYGARPETARLKALTAKEAATGLDNTGQEELKARKAEHKVATKLVFHAYLLNFQGGKWEKWKDKSPDGVDQVEIQDQVENDIDR